MKSVIQKISYQIRPYPTIQKKTGKHAFGLQIVIDGDPRLIPIYVYWFKNQFDTSCDQFKSNEAPEIIRDLNLVLAKEKAKANDILTRYRLLNRIISHKQFRWEFTTSASREDVHEWLTSQAKKIFDNGEISEHTYHNNLSCFTRLKNHYKSPLPFSMLNSAFIVKLDNALRKTFKHNTVSGTHATLSKFFKLAVREGLLPETPYIEKINKSYIAGERESLTLDELNSLIKLFENKHELSETELNTLEMFVFSATSGGYRFSELVSLTNENIKFGVLRMDTPKGRKFGVTLKIDLPEIGLEIIRNRKGKIFKQIAEPTANKKLKYLVSKAGIKKHITFHSARDTFGTLYVYFGGDITTLSKEIFKHSKLETTMIYQKKSTDMKRKDMQNFNRFSLPSFGADNITLDDDSISK